MERFDEGRESMEWDERDRRLYGDFRKTSHLHLYEAGKPSDPITCFRIRSQLVKFRYNRQERVRDLETSASAIPVLLEDRT